MPIVKKSKKVPFVGRFPKHELREMVLNDYRIANESREASLMGRREVLAGKAKFGIFGDGKEVAQLAMAKVFREGDFRSGYYRDQTFMFATNTLDLRQWFAGLYGHTDIDLEPMSAGRQMGGHFSTKSINADGSWNNLMKIKNSSSDISPTGAQMPRLLGLAMASKYYKMNPELKTPQFSIFSNNGDEVAFGTIGDASTSEGVFWEAVNAAGVMQLPMLVSVWDDGHGISVPKKYQTTKESISEILKGFQRNGKEKGYEIFKSKGWDYPHLIETYETAIKVCREEHVPVIIHVEEVTQPQGHSTSGSHERYKSKERLEWEAEFDPIRKMRQWMIAEQIATEIECDEIEATAKQTVKQARLDAWNAFQGPILHEIMEVTPLFVQMGLIPDTALQLEQLAKELSAIKEPNRKDVLNYVRKALRLTIGQSTTARAELVLWLKASEAANHDRYNSHVYSENERATHKIEAIPVQYPSEPKQVDGREVLKENFDFILGTRPEVIIFGEDAGKIGGVNRGLEGLQAKYGEVRVFDTGIREATILGQAIGLAMRGFRPIAEIQYLDYLLYALQIMSDDLATLTYRTKAQQKAPVIVRTRGHRLEGIWHSGSPMGAMIHALRGICICVPRNMTKAAGFYNTLLLGDDPAIVIEPLNGYRLKEQLPQNIGAFRTPLGIPEIIKTGTDVTLVTYGSCCRVALEAADFLEKVGVSVEIVDVQTLLPFDTHSIILQSIQKTNRVLFLDEDVPGGATAYMMQKVVEEQGAFQYLDAQPKTLTAKENRPAYGTDGDYFCKPSADDVFDSVYQMMHEADVTRFPDLLS